MEPLTQTCRGSVIDTFTVRATGNAQNSILSFFIMAEREISISVNNDGTLDPNLWGVGNWHFCCTSEGERTKPNIVIFHNGRAGNFDFRQQRWNPWPKLMGGSVIDTFAVRATGIAQNSILSFFIMAEREILISINNDGTLDPNLWGVSNWHFCCTSDRERTKLNFVIFHNGQVGNFDFCQQRWNPWPKLMGGR